MSIPLLRMCIAVAAIMSAFAIALAHDPESLADYKGSHYDAGPPDDYRCWWMPDSACGCGKCSMLDQCLTPDAEPRDVPSESWLLIDDAIRAMQSPRPVTPYGSGDFTDLKVGVGLDASDIPAWPEHSQFSHTWSDGAPLLLFDWSGKSGDPFAPTSLRLDGVKRVASASSTSDIADLSANVKLRERDAMLDPGVRNAWETDQTVKVPVAGSMFFFNQVTGSTPAVEQQQYKWLNKAGVGLKLKPWLFQEVQVRTGPAVRYDDTGTLTKGQSPEHSELFLEAVTKVPVPLVGPINVEYSSYAVPAATSADHNQINQDVKFALPIGSGQFHVGAKYKWESATATPWMDRMQVYMGVQNKW